MWTLLKWTFHSYDGAALSNRSATESWKLSHFEALYEALPSFVGTKKKAPSFYFLRAGITNIYFKRAVWIGIRIFPVWLLNIVPRPEVRNLPTCSQNLSCVASFTIHTANLVCTVKFTFQFPFTGVELSNLILSLHVSFASVRKFVSRKMVTL